MRARIIAMSRDHTSCEAADALGISRNIVAGIWYRAGIERPRVNKAPKVASEPMVHQKVGGVGCRFIEGSPAGAATVYCNAPRTSVESSYCCEHDRLCHSQAPLSKLTVGRYR